MANLCLRHHAKYIVRSPAFESRRGVSSGTAAVRSRRRRHRSPGEGLLSINRCDPDAPASIHDVVIVRAPWGVVLDLHCPLVKVLLSAPVPAHRQVSLAPEAAVAHWSQGRRWVSLRSGCPAEPETVGPSCLSQGPHGPLRQSQEVTCLSASRIRTHRSPFAT